ncbi:MAG TPA: trehalase family glycosidase [Pyrinomonadaceae bacterium]|nr:trehalase family glycosidase [Pyrinomonadaceae bacterium]
MTPRRRLARALLFAQLTLILPPAGLDPARAQGRATPAQTERATPAQLEKVHEYIRRSWHTLMRSHRGLAAAAVDPKFKPVEHPATYRWPVYVARDENLEAITRGLRAQMKPDDFARIELRRLPEREADAAPGLLYLPRPYVVPGGRFNEMYGWDSYFIQVGLLRDGETELARDMAENFVYEIEHYGRILNANRTYYLTRSQPPFLTRMLLGVYGRTRDRAWLGRVAPSIETYYAYWTSPESPHYVQATGLSRYWDAGDGPAIEVLSDERDEQGRTHYDRVKEFYKTQSFTDYDVTKFYDRASDKLTPAFYKGDRSMRESGFDPSNRFGPFSADITSYNPVCLNSLLYVYERDAAEIMRELGRAREAERWERRAAERAARVNRLMWDERDGLYYDYNFEKKALRRYPFVTTFYPLWAGIATKEQAARVVKNLPMFERAGGLLTSTNRSGSQWDAPYGWAPMQMIAVEGLRRYGFGKEAERVSVNFLSLVLKDFKEHNTIVEKYDVEKRTSNLGAGLRFGYETNEIGFGWTNAAYVELYAQLSPAGREKVLNPDGVGVPEGSN